MKKTWFYPAIVALTAGLWPCVGNTEAGILSGRIVDAQTGVPVAAATVRVPDRHIGVVADSNGGFVIDNIPEEWMTLTVHHVGYRSWRQTVFPVGQNIVVNLEPVILPGQGIVVTASRAVRGESPVAFENMTRQEISQAHYAQDVPQLLTESPGVYAYSDNGNNIGYTYLSVRGFPQRRVSVLINGVPLNDPESHEVYWIDLPDLAENLQDAQIQRGVGTTLYGANSMGGTISLLTNSFSPVRQLSFTSGAGSYGTRKFSLALNSGLIDDRYALYGRFSRIVSDGYRQNAWTDLWSYFFSATRFDAKWTNHLNVFGGPEQTHLAYKGIPRPFIDGDTTFTFNGRQPTGNKSIDRRYNPFEWNGETDNFNQPQYQLISEFQPDSSWLFENTSFYIKGKGYYDQLRFGQKYKKYHLFGPGRADQLARRRWVDNDFWGFVPKVTRRHEGGALTIGGEVQRLSADHWAEVWSVVPAPDSHFVPGQKYYDYQGRKTVVSGFAQEVYSPLSGITLTGAVQYSIKEYHLDNSRFPNGLGQMVSHGTRYKIWSPRFGLTIRPVRDLSLFGSISANRQEPTNDEIFDPQDYDANARDFFRNFDSTTGVGRDPIMKPERLADYEFGTTFQRDRWQLTANLFRMTFRDEIVYNGTLSDDGVPLRANAPSSTHQGIELSVRMSPWKRLTLSGNLSINDNTFSKFTEYAWSGDTINRSGNVVAGFPKHLANLRVTYEQRYAGISGHIFSAGRSYIDNSNSPSASIAPYTVIDLRGEIKLGPVAGWDGLSAFGQINNLTNQSYETGGYLDDDGTTPLFLPAAKRNFYVGLKVNL